jgi:indoleamine 2,3-dioxygenase
LLLYRKPRYVNPPLVDFDIDAETGFHPRRPLPRLQGPFDVWEVALSEAQHVLSLGDNSSDTAAEKRPEGEAWRMKVKSVCDQIIYLYFKTCAESVTVTGS